jgi:hypothetical protein
LKNTESDFSKYPQEEAVPIDDTASVTERLVDVLKSYSATSVKQADANQAILEAVHHNTVRIEDVFSMVKHVVDSSKTPYHCSSHTNAGLVENLKGMVFFFLLFA